MYVAKLALGLRITIPSSAPDEWAGPVCRLVAGAIGGVSYGRLREGKTTACAYKDAAMICVRRRWLN